MRLIDADAFKKVLSEHEMEHDKRRSVNDYDCGAASAYEYASDLLDEMPTVEPKHGECRTCKHFVKGGLDGKTYVCEHPSIEQDDYFNYACLAMDENDFCSCYEKKEGGEK